MIPRAARAPLAVGAAALLGAAYIGLVDPNQPGHYPLCPTKALTGLDCPFCGGLRAAHSLTRLDLVGASDHNLLAVAFAVPLVLLWAAWLRREWIGDPEGRTSHPLQSFSAAVLRPQVLWPVVAALVLFTVVRNVGGVPALAWLGSGASA
ncbi:MAG: DUF2752 domain-containing protein [Candidatus Nanopelagicales bacterium]